MSKMSSVLVFSASASVLVGIFDMGHMHIV